MRDPFDPGVGRAGGGRRNGTEWRDGAGVDNGSGGEGGRSGVDRHCELAENIWIFRLLLMPHRTIIKVKIFT